MILWVSAGLLLNVPDLRMAFWTTLFILGKAVLRTTRRKRSAGDSCDSEDGESEVEGDAIFASGSMSLKLFMSTDGFRGIIGGTQAV